LRPPSTFKAVKEGHLLTPVLGDHYTGRKYYRAREHKISASSPKPDICALMSTRPFCNGPVMSSLPE
jgi:hypothetical protein